jgi:flagellar hook-basal body complex protein FliE
MKITPLSPQQIGGTTPFEPVSRPKAGTKSFGTVIKDALTTIDRKQMSADDKLQALASGREIDIHGTMIAMKEAEISLKVAISMRDKFVEAYQKIMQIQM